MSQQSLDLLDKINKIDKKVSIILQEMERHNKCIESHSNRIRDLEIWKWKVVGVFSGISLLIIFIKQILGELIK